MWGNRKGLLSVSVVLRAGDARLASHRLSVRGRAGPFYHAGALDEFSASSLANMAQEYGFTEDRDFGPVHQRSQGMLTPRANLHCPTSHAGMWSLAQDHAKQGGADLCDLGP